MSWPIVPLSSVFEFIRNGMNVKQDSGAGGLPITRIETISEGKVNPRKVGFAGLGYPEATRWMLKEGDILFSHINSFEHVGKCAVYRGEPAELVHGMNLLCFRSDKAKLNPEYAKHLLRSGIFRAQLGRFINKAVNQASVSIGNLSGIPVSLPPLDEQQRIAVILDKVEELRTKRRAALVLLDQLPQAIFLEMFGEPRFAYGKYDRVTLADLVHDGDRINYGVVQPGDDVADGVPLIRVSDLSNGRVNTESLKRISAHIEAAYTRSRLKGNELLVSCVGSVGAVALADESVRGYNIARAVARIPVGPTANRRYVAEFLRTNTVQHYFKTELRTVSQPTLNIKQLAETAVMMPPLDLQQEFERRVSLVDSLQSRGQKASHTSQLVFEQLQAQLFQETEHAGRD